MHKRTIITCVCLSLCLLFVGAGVAQAATGENIFFLAGEFFRISNNANGANSTDNSQVIASYKGYNITAAMVEYNRNMNILRDAKTADKFGSDREIAEQLIQNIIIKEEAERLGLTATKEEIDLMVTNAIRAYSLPEGKQILDAYCSGAGITFERYIELLREQAPSVIARQKLKNMVGQEYCKEHGIVYSNVNPPDEMVLAQEQYIAELVKSHRDDISYSEVTE